MTTIIDSVSEPRCVADALGLGRLSDGVTDMDPELFRALYRHCRNEDGKRVLFERDSSFVAGWVDLSSAAAQEIIAPLVPLDDESDVKKARNVARSNLQAVAWNDVLGIASPGLKCRIRIHGRKWGMRFESGEPALKGRQQVNEQLPPIPIDGASSSARDGEPAADTPSAAGPDEPVIHSDAAAVLCSAGMPS